jgi:septum formation protein
MQKWQYAPLLLASQSPRRKQLLEEAGFEFRAQGLDVDETYPSTLPLEDVAVYLAAKKMRVAIGLASPDEMVLTADSVVLLDGVHYEKPRDHTDAMHILSNLQDRTHTVITGVAMARNKSIWSGQAETKVTFGPMSDEEIDAYIQNYKPFDKAGAYGIQEWIGLCKITNIEGTYSNVMGLPVHLVYQVFKDRLL